MANPVIEHIYRDGKTYDVKDMYAERSENKTSELRANPDHTKFPTEKAVADALATKEDAANKVTSFGSNPTDTQYPSAKLVKDTIDALGGDKMDATHLVTAFGTPPVDTDFPSEKLVKDNLDLKEDKANRRSSFQATPDDDHYPSEKLVKDSLDAIRTVVVEELPAVANGVPGVNYIVKIDGGGLLYKLIDGAWTLVAGSKVVVAAALPASGDAYTDYYIQNEQGVYVHYRYINNGFVAVGADAYSKLEMDAQMLEKEDVANKVTAFSTPTDAQYPSAKLVKDTLDSLRSNLEGQIGAVDVITSVVVDTLPAVSAAKAGFDYFLKQGNGVLLYKVIDGAWKMVGGAMVSVVDELPDDGEGNPLGDPFTDYYLATEDPKIFLHYRWADPVDELDGYFYAVGADAYSKEEMDTALAGIRQTHATDKAATDAEIAQANRNIQTNATNIAALTDQQRSYRANLDQQGDNYFFELTEAIGEGDGEVVSRFQLPATGGGGGQSATTNLVVERVTETPVILTPTDKALIQVNFSSTDADNEDVDASYVLKLGSTTIMTGAMTKGLNTFDVTEFCSVGSQKFTLQVTDDGGSMNTKSWTVQIVDVRIETTFSDRYTFAVGRKVNFTYTPYGSVSKTVHFKLDGRELDPVVTTASGILQSYELPTQTHGAHLLEVWITATVNSKAIETDHIFKDIIWYDEESDDPVIGCIYRFDYFGAVEARQYNTTNIPYVVYDPRTSTPTVELKVDGTVVSELHLTNPANSWAYKTDIVAVHTLAITCRNKTVTMRVNVSELGYDIQPVTANLEFDFNPTGLTNTSANRLWTDANNPDVKMSVSDNFDWNNGGYQMDEDGNQYFCVKSGTRAYFSHNLFGVDPKQNGAEFKIIFKTTNVRDKDAVFLTCLTGNNNDGAGLEMRTHLATFFSSSASLEQPYSEEDVIEYEYNILAIDTEDSSATSFVMTYEDGVGGRPLIYPNDDGYRLYQLSPAPITVGSDDCDVWIYRMKAYASALTDSNILSNFIADARDSDTMIARFERNLIYNENNELTPESVADACPDLKIIKISCPHFTNDKKDYVKWTNVECIHRNGDAALDNWTFTNGYHAGQGTTSNRYGLAGRNIDIIFGFDGQKAVIPPDKEPFDEEYISTLTLGDGTKYTDGSGKVALTRGSVPNDWFNIKVNIASSENANNALLQKRYNDYIPYKTPGQKRDPRIKNSMEFVNCVIFVRETDADISTHREFSDTNWHFYAIGNIGDSKKTDNTRVNDPEDQKEHVIEISDNTLPNSYFDTGLYWAAGGAQTFDPNEAVLNEGLDIPSKIVYPITLAQWRDSRNLKHTALYEDWDGSFEFRYDMGTKDGETITDEMSAAQQEASKQVFRDMYEFVITSNDAAFANNFGNWFVTESFLYWYLFTERYTMTDNRAKNSFWHWGRVYISEATAAEWQAAYEEDPEENKYKNPANYIIDNAAAAINDGYRYDLWDYDNDTALGIDNNGELKMTYGKEDTDYKTDGDPSSGYIFNAADSVIWRRIRELMGPQLRAMYQSRESLNCWSASSLIAEFDAWQEQFPEELWRLDIERKYLRPYYSGNPVAGIQPNRDFLENMMNGRKRYQRRQFERDQEIYMGTKYFGTNQCADTRAISFRCNTPQSAVVRPDYTLRIVPYSDMYLWVAYGNSTPQGVRAKAGQEYVFTTALTTMDDTMILVYCAENIQAINDLSACYIRANDFSAAKRLKTLIIGSNVAGYSNPFITTLSIKDNTLLETLDIRNCPNLTGSLNFAGCPNLLTLLAEGTSVTGVTFARNGKIQSAHLPATINALTLNYLQYLEDLTLASYANLVTLVSEYCSLDTRAILEAAVDTLQIVRILGIDWTFYSTEVLNKVYAMSTSVLAGRAEITGYIRQGEIDRYNAKWTDLELVYNSDNIVPQQVVYYRNYDGTELGRTLVDRGSTPPDPLTAGIISAAPTREPDDQYTYTHSGWDGLETPVYVDTDVFATYSTELRTYTVEWCLHPGDSPSDRKSVPYGSEAIYEGVWPTDYTAESISHTYRVFKEWDKSTGCVKSNMTVYAVWQEALIPAPTKELSEMTAAEVYAVSRNALSAERYSEGDYVDITLGYDPDFSNVESEVLLENRWFNGREYVETDVKLFDADEPSFTLAIDYEFLLSNSTGATLASCVDTAQNLGFMLGFQKDTSSIENSYSRVAWASNNYQRVGRSGLRNIVVLKHEKGSPDLYVYSFSGSTTSSRVDAYDWETARNLLIGQKNAVHSRKLTFGATAYNEANGVVYGNYATGWIHWCKVWYDDLGDAVCKRIVNWPRETIRGVYVGHNRQFISGSQIMTADAQFVFGAPLSRAMPMSISGYSMSSWKDSRLQMFGENRVFKAFPNEWQSAIKQVRVNARESNYTSNMIFSDDHLYLQSIREIYSGSASIGSGYYDAEQPEGYLSYYDNVEKRVMFPGLIVEDRNQSIPGRRTFTNNTDPTRTGEQMADGDIWFNSQYSYYQPYIFISKEKLDKHNYLANRLVNRGDGSVGSSCIIPYDSVGSPGLWVLAHYWKTRSPYYTTSSGYTYYFYSRYYRDGTTNSYYNSYEAIVFGFSV